MIKTNFVKAFFILLVFTVSCGFKRNSFENYQSTINEAINPKSSEINEAKNIHDVKDMRGCGMSIELGTWYRNETLSKFRDREIWSRPSSGYDHGIIGSGDECIDCNANEFTPNLINNKNFHILYIGPWQYVKEIGKEIRFVAYTGRGGGDVNSQFESKNDQNQSIKQRPFYLNPKLHDVTDRTGLCIVKWIANYGYNAVSRVKSRNPFSRNYLVPTGEIIDAYSKEILVKN